MIHQVRLRAGICTSRIGFGTSRLHHLGRHARRLLVDTAFDAGVTHFDTAPSYGDGLAESELSALLRGRRDRCVVVSKYGVPIDPVAEMFPGIYPVWRVARSVARRIGAARRGLPALCASGLVASVEGSLKRLKSDYLDILMLHEPSMARLDGISELLEQLEKLKASGRIRCYGIAGKWQDIAAIANGPAAALAQVVQTAESEWPPDGSPPDITYGAIARGSQSYFQGDIGVVEAEVRFRAALARRPNGVVLVSTTRAENLQRIIQLASGA